MSAQPASTTHDLAPFTRGLGYLGPPFIWNEEETQPLRAPEEIWD